MSGQMTLPHNPGYASSELTVALYNCTVDTVPQAQYSVNGRTQNYHAKIMYTYIHTLLYNVADYRSPKCLHFLDISAHCLLPH